MRIREKTLTYPRQKNCMIKLLFIQIELNNSASKYLLTWKKVQRIMKIKYKESPVVF